MDSFFTAKNFWKKLSLQSVQDIREKSDIEDAKAPVTEIVLEQMHDTIRDQYYGNRAFATDAPRLAESTRLTNVYGLLILVSIVAGVLLLMLTRFEHPEQAVAFYDEREYGLIQLATFQVSANAGGIRQRETTHQKYIPLIRHKLLADPGNEELRYYLGVCYFRTNQLKEATRVFSVLSRQGTRRFSEKAGFRLGLSLWKAGHYVQAKAVFEKLSCDVEHPYREKSQEILNKAVFRSL